MDSLNGIALLFLLFMFLVSVSWAKGKLRRPAGSSPNVKADK